MPKLHRKQRTRAHVLEALSFNHLERAVLANGWALERIENDYGYDAMMFTYSALGYIETGQVWL